jgi:hypothetical protein
MVLRGAGVSPAILLHTTRRENAGETPAPPNARPYMNLVKCISPIASATSIAG